MIAKGKKSIKHCLKKGGPAHILRKKGIDTDCGKKDLKRLVERRKMARKGESYIKKRVDEKRRET